MSLQINKYSLVVIGGSAGGFSVLKHILSSISQDFPAAIVLVLHIPSNADSSLSKTLSHFSRLPVIEAADKIEIKPGTVYCAPPGYHLLVEKEKTLALSIDPVVWFSRPSIDVLFESAARAYQNLLTGILLTGASQDGAAGLSAVKDSGGYVIVENPKTAAMAVMPQAGLKAVRADQVLDFELIGPFLMHAAKEGPNE